MNSSDLSCTDLIFLCKVNCYADSEDCYILFEQPLHSIMSSLFGKDFERDLATTLGQASQTKTIDWVCIDVAKLHFFMSVSLL